VKVRLRGCTTGLAIDCLRSHALSDLSAHEIGLTNSLAFEHSATILRYTHHPSSIILACCRAQAKPSTPLRQCSHSSHQTSLSRKVCARRRCGPLSSHDVACVQIGCLHRSVQPQVWEVAADAAAIDRDLLRNNMTLCWVLLASLEDVGLSRVRTHIFLRPVF
jgi:hypothetical protein